VPPTAGGQFVVCRGGVDTTGRVYMVDEVRATATYRGRPSTFLSPVYLAVTDDGFVLVLDAHNKRVVLLDPDLTYVRDVVAADHGLNEPSRLCWDDVNSRLYVAESAGDVLVFELLPNQCLGLE